MTKVYAVTSFFGAKGKEKEHLLSGVFTKKEDAISYVQYQSSTFLASENKYGFSIEKVNLIEKYPTKIQTLSEHETRYYYKNGTHKDKLKTGSIGILVDKIERQYK